MIINRLIGYHRQKPYLTPIVLKDIIFIKPNKCKLRQIFLDNQILLPLQKLSIYLLITSRCYFYHIWIFFFLIVLFKLVYISKDNGLPVCSKNVALVLLHVRHFKKFSRRFADYMNEYLAFFLIWNSIDDVFDMNSNFRKFFFYVISDDWKAS